MHVTCHQAKEKGEWLLCSVTCFTGAIAQKALVGSLVMTCWCDFCSQKVYLLNKTFLEKSTYQKPLVCRTEAKYTACLI